MNQQTFVYLEKIKRNEFRAVIKHFYLKRLTPKEIKAELDEVRGTSAPVFATVYNWVNEFKRGRTSTKDEHHSGRPVEAKRIVNFQRPAGPEEVLLANLGHFRPWYFVIWYVMLN